MVEFKYNDMTDQWDAEMLYELGDLKEMVCVASVEPKNNTITFWKPLSIADVRSIVLHYDELKFQLEKNPLDDLKLKQKPFELDPDGTDNE